MKSRSFPMGLLALLLLFIAGAMAGTRPAVALPLGLPVQSTAKTLAATNDDLIVYPAASTPEVGVYLDFDTNSGVGTVTFYGTVNGSTWHTVSATPLGGGATVTTATATGWWRIDGAGFTQVRARFTTATSGSVLAYGYSTGAGQSDISAAMTVADGADVTLGAKSDAKSSATDTTATSVMSQLKNLNYMLQNPASLPAGSNDVGTVHMKPTTGAFTQANPSISNTTSTTIVSAATYNFIELINPASSGVTFYISLSGTTITAASSTNANPTLVLPPGAEWHSPPNFTPTNAIKAYQSSGGSTDALTVITG